MLGWVAQPAADKATSAMRNFLVVARKQSFTHVLQHVAFRRFFLGRYQEFERFVLAIEGHEYLDDVRGNLGIFLLYTSPSPRDS